jgi:uncharacterized membrane protein YuzA (DUF378 family)
VKKLDILTAALVIVGGLNWGLVAIAEFDLVATLVGLEFGETNAASRVVYGLVGVAAAYQLTTLASVQRRSSRDPQVAAAHAGRRQKTCESH